VADILSALPLGPIVAWVLRLPGIRHAVGAILGLFESRPLSHFFGIRSPAAAPPVRPLLGPSPLRRGAGRLLGVLCELAIVAMFAGAVNQALVELWVVNRRVKVPHPEPLRLLVDKLRFRQGWSMFSPDPLMFDGKLVVDAVTVDGRKVDPFTGREPDFELLNAKSLRYSQIWCDYLDRIHWPAYSGYRDAMKEYLYRLPERTGRPEDAIVSGDVYWVHDVNPRWRRTESTKYEREKVFSFVNPKAQPRAANP
jgi:hypothetical protein